MSNYNDLQQHIDSLRKKGLLIEVDRPIDKDSEMHAFGPVAVHWRYERGRAQGLFIHEYHRWQRP